jgi:DNA polymerase III subunit delta
LKLSGAAASKFLDKPDKAVRAVLLYGPNATMIAEGAQRLARWALGKSDDPYAVTRLGEDEIKRDGARLADALAAQSLMGGPTIVWARVDGKGADGAVLEALGAIESGAPSGYLIIEGGDLGGSAAIVKAFNNAKHAAAAAFYEETEAERAAFARGFAGELGLKLDRDGTEALIAALPCDRGPARRELEKLATYAHGLERELTREDVRALMTDESEGALDEAGLAAMSGRAAEAVEALARIDTLAGVSALRALGRRLLQIAEVRTQMDQGASAADAVGKLRPPVFWKERDLIAGQARAWSAKKLNAAFDLVWTAELRCKQAGNPHALIAAEAFRGVAKLVEARL